MTEAKGCGSGLPCVFVNKGTWIPITEDDGPKPYPIESDSWQKVDTTLFIMIASFRDKLCPKTLFYAFSKAKYPSRVTIGVVEQNLPDDVDCLEEYCRLMKEHTQSEECLYMNNIRMVKKHASESKVSLSITYYTVFILSIHVCVFVLYYHT